MRTSVRLYSVIADAFYGKISEWVGGRVLSADIGIHQIDDQGTLSAIMCTNTAHYGESVYEITRCTGV